MRYIFASIFLLFNVCATHAHTVQADTLSIVETAELASADVQMAEAEAPVVADESAVVADESAVVADGSAVAAGESVVAAEESAVAACETPAADDDPATRFCARQLAFPAAAIALGGAGVKNHLFDTNSDRERWTTVDDQLQYVPIVAYAGLGFIPGVKHRHNFGERFLAGATAYVFMTGMAQGLKHIVREPRPDTGKENSFPSGHTATAFCGAELCRLEYGNAYGAAAYAFAAATGVMRVVNNRHWCNDVLAGAGIGFLSAHVGYWLLPWEKRVVRRVFHRDASSTAFLLAPSYQYETKAPSFTFAMTF